MIKEMKVVIVSEDKIELTLYKTAGDNHPIDERTIRVLYSTLNSAANAPIFILYSFCLID